MVGADGRLSSVAEAVGPEQYNARPLSAATTRTSATSRSTASRCTPCRARWAAPPTNDGLTLVVAGCADAEYEDVPPRRRGHLSLALGLGARVRRARPRRDREERVAGTVEVPNYFRKPYGPGWALVGDAGYNKDFITAMGITDAFHDAELLAGALHTCSGNEGPFDDGMGRVPAHRDEASRRCSSSRTMLARDGAAAAGDAQLLGAVAASQEAMDQFARVMGGTLPPPAFFNPDNIGRIMAQAHPEGEG